MTVTWSWRPFADLSIDDLYEALKLRQRVFVLEQTCLYLDLDGHDRSCWHGLGHLEDGQLAAYARIVPPGLKFAGPSIGRVVTEPRLRGRGLGVELMSRAIDQTRRLFPGQDIHIAAQAHLEAFYRRFGFQTSGPPYDDDGILHVDMTVPAPAAGPGS